MRLLSRSDKPRNFSAFIFSTWPRVVIDVVIFDVEGHVDEEPLLQVDLLVDLSMEPLLRYHAKVRVHVELDVVDLFCSVAVDQLHYRRSEVDLTLCL